MASSVDVWLGSIGTRVISGAGMLDQLTLSMFSACLGNRFQMHESAEHAVDVELIVAESLGSANARPSAEREPFSLIFRGPKNLRAPQRIYRLSHDRLPDLDIFLVPLGPDQQGTRYQAIFT